MSGRTGITSCHWYAVDWNRNVWTYREHYGSGLDSDQHAREICKRSHVEDCQVNQMLSEFDITNEEHMKMLRYADTNCNGKECEQYQYTVMDSAAWSKLGLPQSTNEIYEANGVSGLIPSSKARIMGWDIVHQYLRWEDNEDPKVKFFVTCPNIIRTLPTLIHDELRPEDVDTKGEDHAADELRYFLQTLRDQKSLKPTNKIEQRIREIKESEEMERFSYRRNG